MTVDARTVVTVAVMSCGCEYATLHATRPPSHCPEHGGPLVLLRYDTQPAAPHPEQAE